MGLLRGLAFAVAAVGVVLASHGCREGFDPAAAGDAEPWQANIAIAELVDMYRGRPTVIGENLVICGRVTSSDRAGNFYRSLMVEQDGAAVEIRAALTDMYNIWPPGCRVAVRLQGLAMGEEEGVKCIGLPAARYSYNIVDYIPSRVELDRIIARSQAPEAFGIPNFYVSMLDRSMCGRLVRVVALIPSDYGPQTDGTDGGVRQWGGVNYFEDDETGERIAVRVSDYADFARRRVPSCQIAMAGILQFGRPEGADEDMFILKPRDESDALY